MSKTKSGFSLYANIFGTSLLSLILILELLSIMNFRGVVKKNILRVIKLNDATLATLPHPPGTFKVHQQTFRAMYTNSGAIITGGTTAEATNVVSFDFYTASPRYIENYYLEYFSSEGWQMDRNKDKYPNGDFSYEFHRQSTCATVEIQPSKGMFVLGVWHDFWKEIPPLENLFGIPVFLVGWQYVVPDCPEIRP